MRYCKKCLKPDTRPDYALGLEEAGAGEILVNAIDRDGAKTGYDLDLVEEVAKAVSVPVIAIGGAGHWHVLVGQTVYPVQIAAHFKIPLIVWGVHQGCDQVSHLDEVKMTRKYRCDHDLMGLEAEYLVGGHECLTEADLGQFAYPHDKVIAEVGIRGIYLSNYICWDSKQQHEDMLDLYGYETAVQQRTFDTYNHADCQHYAGLHDQIKFLKHGYGKATDHACREIRLGRMSREEGIEMVRRYRNVVPIDKARYLD